MHAADLLDRPTTATVWPGDVDLTQIDENAEFEFEPAAPPIPDGGEQRIGFQALFEGQAAFTVYMTPEQAMIHIAKTSAQLAELEGRRT